MNDNKLKQILKQQVASFDEDIDKKMAFLKSGAFFNYNFYQYDFLHRDTDKLFSAFTGDQDDEEDESFNQDETLFLSEQENSLNDHDRNQNINDYGSETDYQQRKKAIIARIAALRGTSLPGEYLHHRK